MATKQLITFLGTNSYMAARYYFGADPFKDEPVTYFVQEAIILKECTDWKQEDEILIFLTEDARKKNWEGNGVNYEGLSSRIKQLGVQVQIKPVDIPDIKNEKEIWELFTTVYEKMKENAEIVFDITHAFRFMPMLVMVLINYAKVLKNIRVSKIYYGAFERLGSLKQAEQIAEEKRFAPVMDLTGFSEIQDWASAAGDFVKFGNSNRLQDLSFSEVKPVLKESKGKHEAAKHIRELNGKLKKFSGMMSTMRGREIIEGTNALELKETLEAVKNDPVLIPALTPLLDETSRGIGNLSEKNDPVNMFRAVEWSLKYNKIQQAYTLLREAVITYVLKMIFPENFSSMLYNVKEREPVSSAITIISGKISEDDWKVNDEEKEKIKEKINRIKDAKLPDEFIKEFVSLGNLRNDIMHAGMNDNPSKPDTLRTHIQESFDNIIKLLGLVL